MTESEEMGRMGPYVNATEAGQPGRGATKEQSYFERIRNGMNFEGLREMQIK